MTTIYQQDGVERVDSRHEAYCPDCDARYAAHRDGDCVQCGTALQFGIDHEAVIMMAFERRVTELAEDHAPDGMSSYPVCSACVNSTPLAMDSASDLSDAEAWRDVAEAAEDAIEALGTDPHWVRGALADAYVDAYYAACADPHACEVCRDAAAGADDCGHARTGEDCPVVVEGR